MSTRQRIISVALRLFNEQGSHAVTTNDLAAQLGISVGNLYYHFRNKEEIIRAVFEQLAEAWHTRLVVPNPAAPGWADLEALIAEHFAILWEYRFFYREQMALRQRDPVLARRWTIIHRRGSQDMKLLLQALCSTQPVPPHVTQADLQRITDICWILADYWMAFTESRGGQLRRSDLAAGVDLFRTTVIPLLASLGVHFAPAPPGTHSPSLTPAPRKPARSNRKSTHAR